MFLVGNIPRRRLRSDELQLKVLDAHIGYEDDFISVMTFDEEHHTRAFEDQEESSW